MFDSSSNQPRAQAEIEVTPSEGMENSFVLISRLASGEKVGHCTMTWNEFRHMYALTNLVVDPKYQRGSSQNIKPDEYHGFGSQLLEAAKKFLIERKAKGYLINTIEDRNKVGMYEKYGWQQDEDNPKLFFFDGAA